MSPEVNVELLLVEEALKCAVEKVGV